MSGKAGNRKASSRRSPQMAYADSPDHYENDDIPHVLARVRFMREFFNVVSEDGRLEPLRFSELHCCYMDLLNEALAPYALDLALSLIALEDSLDPEK
jgi:hypothetical protein